MSGIPAGEMFQRESGPDKTAISTALTQEDSGSQFFVSGFIWGSFKVLRLMQSVFPSFLKFLKIFF